MSSLTPVPASSDTTWTTTLAQYLRDKTSTPAEQVLSALAQAALAQQEQISTLRANLASDFVKQRDKIKYLNEEDNERALQALDVALVLNPRNVKALLARANCLANLGKLAEARGDYDAAVAIDPQNRAALIARGEFYSFDLNDKRQALKDYSAVLAIDPEDFGTLYERGKLYFVQKDYASALADLNAMQLTRVTVRDQLYKCAYKLRSEIYEAQDEWQKAIDDLKMLSAACSSKELNPYDVKIHELQQKLNEKRTQQPETTAKKRERSRSPDCHDDDNNRVKGVSALSKKAKSDKQDG